MRRKAGAAPQVLDQISGKQALTAMFSGIMFLVDFASEVESGRDLLTAGKRAKRKAARRTAALARAELEVVEDDAGHVDVDVEVKRVSKGR